MFRKINLKAAYILPAILFILLVSSNTYSQSFGVVNSDGSITVTQISTVNANDFNADGYNNAGYDHDGYDKNGYDENGYNREGYNKNGRQRGSYTSSTGNTDTNADRGSNSKSETSGTEKQDRKK